MAANEQQALLLNFLSDITRFFIYHSETTLGSPLAHCSQRLLLDVPPLVLGPWCGSSEPQKSKTFPLIPLTPPNPQGGISWGPAVGIWLVIVDFTDLQLNTQSKGLV